MIVLCLILFATRGSAFLPFSRRDYKYQELSCPETVQPVPLNGIPAVLQKALAVVPFYIVGILKGFTRQAPPSKTCGSKLAFQEFLLVSYMTKRRFGLKDSVSLNVI